MSYFQKLINGIRTIAPRLELGFGSRLGLVLGFRDNQTTAIEENFPLLGLGFGLRLVLGLGAIFLGGNCPRNVINMHL